MYRLKKLRRLNISQNRALKWAVFFLCLGQTYIHNWGNVYLWVIRLLLLVHRDLIDWNACLSLVKLSNNIRLDLADNLEHVFLLIIFSEQVFPKVLECRLEHLIEDHLNPVLVISCSSQNILLLNYLLRARWSCVLFFDEQRSFLLQKCAHRRWEPIWCRTV